MVLALSAVVVAGVMFYYQSSAENNKLQSTQSELTALVSVVSGLYSGRSNYSGLETSQIVRSGHLPPSLVDTRNDKISNPFGGSVDIGTANSGTLYTLAFDGIPRGPCIKLASTHVGSILYQLDANGSAVNMTTASAVEKCNSATANVLKWYLR